MKDFTIDDFLDNSPEEFACYFIYMKDIKF